jgi:hypothetical protein
VRAITRDTDDHRRAGELDKAQPLAKFSGTSIMKHLTDGQIVVIKGTGQLLWRDGNKTYTITGIEVP